MLLFVFIIIIVLILSWLAAFKAGQGAGRNDGFVDAQKRSDDAARSLALLNLIKQAPTLQHFQNSPEMSKVEKALTPAPLKPKPIMNWAYEVLLWLTVLVVFLVLLVL